MREGERREGDPLRRALTGTVTALRERQHLPRRDQRRASALWLRPNWPDALVLSIHRNRLVEALAQDEALRREVRDLLKLADVPAVEGLRATPGRRTRAFDGACERVPCCCANGHGRPGGSTRGGSTRSRHPNRHSGNALPERAAAGTRTGTPDTRVHYPIHQSCAPPQMHGVRYELRMIKRNPCVGTCGKRKGDRPSPGRTHRGDRKSRDRRSKRICSARPDAFASAKGSTDLCINATGQDHYVAAEARRRTRRAWTDLRELRERISEAEQALALAQETLDRERRGRRWP